MQPAPKPPLSLLLLLAGGVLSSGPARAQPLPPPSPAQRAAPSCETNPACLSLYDQAREQSERRNLPEALRLYQLAYQVRADPTLLFNIARLHQKLGQTEEATRNYLLFIDSPLNDPAQKQKARDYLAEIEPPPSSTPAALGPLSPNREDRKPVYKKGWFWTILGTVAAAGIAGGVAGGVLAKQQFSGPTISPF